MSYRSIPNWPPLWTTTRFENHSRPTGEVGTLEEAVMTDLFDNKVFLLMRNIDGNRYLGSLLFDDSVFCRQVFRFSKIQSGQADQRHRRLGSAAYPLAR
jgi:hypothetical protein